MKAFGLAICSLLILLGAGCVPVPIPGKIDTSPEVYGRVVDSQNGQPVPGATITFKDLEGKRRSSTATQADGAFHIMPEWHRYAVVVFTACPVHYIPKRPPHAWFLEITHAAYTTREVDMRYDYPHDGSTGVIVVRLGDVKLTPVGSTPDRNGAKQASDTTSEPASAADSSARPADVAPEIR